MKVAIPDKKFGPASLTLLLLGLVTGAACQEYNGTLADLSGQMDVGETVLVNGTALTLISIEPVATNSTKRAFCAPNRYTYQQTQVVQTGKWWGDWRKVSGCGYCQLSSGTCHQALGWSVTHESSFSAGFNVGTSGKVLYIINGNGGFNLGYSWSNSRSDSGTWTCDINAGDKASVWEQKLMGWSDSQDRDVHMVTGCGAYSESYGSWSAYRHADWPIQGNNDQNWGCSSGSNSNC